MNARTPAPPECHVDASRPFPDEVDTLVIGAGPGGGTVAGRLAEATPTVLLEAQATGLPILATDVGGVRDIVAAQAGFLGPAADPNALADRLTVMVDHPERWPDMGRAGRRFVAERHDITDLDARLAALFEQVVAGIREEP